MRTPLSRVLHLGASGSGTDHFWRSRLTAAANLILVPAFIVIILAAIGRPHAEVVELLGSPLVSAILVLLIVSVAVHMRLGIQTSVEDYIHTEPLKLVLLVGSTFFSAAVGVAAILAVLSMTFGG